jgi:membrane protein insertase Oxa1/YidC/SpoIIIJ
MIFWFGFAASRMTYEIQAFMKEKELNPLKNLMVPLIQVSFRLSVMKLVISYLSIRFC